MPFEVTRRRLLQAAGAGAGLNLLRYTAGCAGGGSVWPAGGASAPTAELPQFDHIVVLMMENRSLDNLLGFLYDPAAGGPAFEGVASKSLSNPIPAGADQAERGVVPVTAGGAADDPNPDPGEEYPHINTQLYGTVAPETFNVPDPLSAVAPMNGFVLDYINTFTATMGRPPTYDEYRRIMYCFPPGFLPVVNTLARQFAVCDHWHCAVPSQTFCNRSFFHAGTSSGWVVNAPYVNWVTDNRAETIFERIEAARDRGLSWGVYFDKEDILSLTALIHWPRIGRYLTRRFWTMERFYDDVRNGRLPSYAFVEPRMLLDHNDMHPPGQLLGRTETSTVTAGELLIAQIYEAIRTSDSPSGSNYQNTLLVITFDEHGGCYDHVPPPIATPPDAANAPAGQMGFRFDRLGVRVPTLLISAYIEPGTVVSTPLDHCSMLRTIERKWEIDPLTDRDAAANDIGVAFNRTTPRAREAWPALALKPANGTQAARDASAALPPLQRPLNGHQRDMAGLAQALGEAAGRPPATIGEALATLRSVRLAAVPG